MGRPPISKQAMSATERSRRHRARLRGSKPVTKPVSPDNATLKQLAQVKTELAQAKKELAAAEARIAELEKTSAAADMSAEIATLRDENYKFRVELEAWHHVITTRSGGGLTKAQFDKFTMVFHPDNSASKETREWASRIFRQLRYVLCNEAALPTMDERKFSVTYPRLWRTRQRDIKEAKKYAKRRRGQPKASPKPSKNLGHPRAERTPH